MTPGADRLAPLEVASGLVFGLTDDAPRPGPAKGTPREALEAAVLRALLRPPCLVSFSGGRDSSAILAVAQHVARREGLAAPIPATNRFPALPSTDESAWQEQVVTHLGIDDWVRVEHGSELDCVGPVAQNVLIRHGLLWPFNAHFHAPLLALAGGGSLLTGLAGDEMLLPAGGARVLDVFAGRARPELRDVLRTGFVLSPPAVRRAVLRRRLPLHYPWLRPSARSAVAAEWAAQGASEPLRWAAHVRWVQRFRYFEVGVRSLELLAAGDDVLLAAPFLDPDFAAAVAGLGRRERFRGRTAAMTLLVGDLLPEPVLARGTKTPFDQAFWNEHSCRFAAEWDGSGVDEELVDKEALRAEWASESPDGRSFTLLQSAWLAQHGRSGRGLEQTLDRVAQ
jgi:asparagine synthetase B (glutamine-hydrolysing)